MSTPKEAIEAAAKVAWEAIKEANNATQDDFTLVDGEPADD